MSETDTQSLRLDRESIKGQILATLKELARLYEMGPAENLKVDSATPGSFADGWERQGQISTAEALECFFVPYFKVAGVREAFWKGELIPLSSVRDSLSYLAVACKSDPTNDGLNSLSGVPYMNFKNVADSSTPSGVERNWDFLDTACFLLACLLDAKAISHDREIMIAKGRLNPSTPDIMDNELLGAIDERIIASATLLRNCDLGGGTGWTFTDDPQEPERLDHLYFTWTALETLEVVVHYAEVAPFLIPSEVSDLWGTGGLLDSLRLVMREKQSYLSAKFLSPDNESLYLCETKIDFGQDDSNWYYNLFVLISLILSGSRDTHRLAAGCSYLLNNVRGMTLEKAKKKDHGTFLLAGSLYSKHKQDWSERALLPLMLKALAGIRQLGSELIDQVVNETEDYGSASQLVDFWLKQLEEQKLPLNELGFGDVWDRQAGEARISIYYTNRVVEALSKVYAAFISPMDVRHFFAEAPTPQRGVSERSDAAGPSVSITISEDVILESVLNDARRAAEDKIREFLASEEFTNLVEEQVLSRAESTFKSQIDGFFEYLSANIGQQKPSKSYKHSLDVLTEIIGKQLGEAIFVMLASADPKRAKTIDKADFLSRLIKGIAYWLEWETREKGPIDYGRTLSELQSKNLIQFSDRGKPNRPRE